MKASKKVHFLPESIQKSPLSPWKHPKKVHFLPESIQKSLLLPIQTWLSGPVIIQNFNVIMKEMSIGIFFQLQIPNDIGSLAKIDDFWEVKKLNHNEKERYYPCMDSCLDLHVQETLDKYNKCDHKCWRIRQ